MCCIEYKLFIDELIKPVVIPAHLISSIAFVATSETWSAGLKAALTDDYFDLAYFSKVLRTLYPISRNKNNDFSFVSHKKMFYHKT